MKQEERRQREREEADMRKAETEEKK
jgi:hypothetical protein